MEARDGPGGGQDGWEGDGAGGGFVEDVGSMARGGRRFTTNRQPTTQTTDPGDLPLDSPTTRTAPQNAFVTSLLRLVFWPSRLPNLSSSTPQLDPRYSIRFPPSARTTPSASLLSPSPLIHFDRRRRGSGNAQPFGEGRT